MNNNLQSKLWTIPRIWPLEEKTPNTSEKTLSHFMKHDTLKTLTDVVFFDGASNVHKSEKFSS